MAIEPDIVVAVGRRADSTVTIANLRGQVYGERTFDTAHVPAVDPDQHDWSNYVLAAYQVRAATRPRNQWQRPPTLPSDADGGRVAFPSLFVCRLPRGADLRPGGAAGCQQGTPSWSPWAQSAL